MPGSDDHGRARGGSRKLKWVVGLLLGMLALFAFLPQLIALTPLRHDLPRTKLKGFEGKIRVGSASLAWWSPIVLRDMELFAPDGQPFIHIKEYIEQRTVFTLLFRRREPAQLLVREAVVDLKVRPDGSNVEDAMQPVIDYKKAHPTDEKERTIEVSDAVIKAVDADSGRAAEWNQVALRIHASPSEAQSDELKLTARLAGAAEAGPLELHATWPSEAARAKRDAQTRQTFALKTSELPLECLGPVLCRMAPDLQISGLLTTDLHVMVDGGTSPLDSDGLLVEGKTALKKLDVACPSRLGADRFVMQAVNVDVRLTSDNVLCHVERFVMNSDLGQMTAAGLFPVGGSRQGLQANLAARLNSADFRLQGDLDLVRLVNLLPNTLHVRAGAQLTDGRITLDVTSTANGDRPRWQGKIESTKLAAKIGAEQVSWEQPVRVTFDVRREPKRIEIDALQCESDVMEFTGKGNTDDAQFSGHCDLDKLVARIGQFVDLREARLHGRLATTASLKRAPDGLLAVASQTTLDNFEIGMADGVWREPRLVSDLHGRIADDNLRPTQVRALQVAVAGAAEHDTLKLTLVEPVDLRAENPAWNWDVQIHGDLEHWNNRLPALGLGSDLKLAGAVQSTSKLKFSKDDVALEGSTGLKGVKLSVRGYDLSEPEMQLTAALRWNRADRKLTVPELTLTGTAGSARGRDIVLGLSNKGFPELAGRFELHTDLDRLNPPEAPPDQRTWTGKVNGEMSFTQQGAQTDGNWSLVVEDLSVRRRVVNLVERKRGEVEQLQPEPPIPQVQQPPPGVVLDRRARRAMERAEREARRDAKRQERALRKRAEEIVLVREEGWETVWTDPRLTLSGQTRFDRDHDRIELTKLELATDGMHLAAQGHVTEASSRAVIDLAGQADYDVAKFLARLETTIGRHVRVVGSTGTKFSVNGPLRQISSASPPEPRAVDAVVGEIRPVSHSAEVQSGPVVPLDLKAQSEAAWQSADLFGLQAGPGVIALRLEQGVVAMQPLEMELSGGRLKAAPRVLLTGRPAMIVLPSGPALENVALSQDVCDSWLKYIAPILSEATRVEGRFSVSLDESRLPASDPAAGEFSGRFDVLGAQVLPGPLFAEIAGFLGQIQSTVTRGAPTDLIGLDQPLVRIDKQSVQFKLADRRLHHSPMDFNMRNVIIRTRGSVGVDQSLDLIAEIFLPRELGRLLPGLNGKALEIPVRGTLRHPQLDGSAIGNAWEQFGLEALDSLLNGGLQNLFGR